MEEPESDPDFDEEQYQNELNDAVDDGGGCMETLQAANQVSNSNETDFGVFNTDENRRSVLQKQLPHWLVLLGSVGCPEWLPGVKDRPSRNPEHLTTPTSEATDVEVRAGDEVPRATAMALNNPEINKLKAAMRSEGKMQPSGIVSVDVETTDPDLNDIDPRVVIVPFEPVGNRPVDPRDTTGQTDPANVGALFAVTVVQEGERQAATVFWGCFSPNTVRSKTIERVDNGASDAGQFQAKLMTFGQDQAGEEPAMVGSQTTKLPIRNARRPNQDQNSSSSLNSVGTGSGLSPRRRYPKARYSPVSNVLRWSVSCANSEGSPQPKYLCSAVSASDYYYRGLSDLFRGLSVGRRGDFTCRLWTWLRVRLYCRRVL